MTGLEEARERRVRTGGIELCAGLLIGLAGAQATVVARWLVFAAANAAPGPRGGRPAPGPWRGRALGVGRARVSPRRARFSSGVPRPKVT